MLKAGKWKTMAVLAVLTFVSATFAHEPGSRESLAEIKWSVVPLKTTLRSGEKLKFQVTLQNTGKAPKTIMCKFYSRMRLYGDDTGRFGFRLRWSIWRTKNGYRYPIKLAPGQSTSYVVVTPALHDLPSPGTYRARAQIGLREEVAPGSWRGSNGVRRFYFPLVVK